MSSSSSSSSSGAKHNRPAASAAPATTDSSAPKRFCVRATPVQSSGRTASSSQFGAINPSVRASSLPTMFSNQLLNAAISTGSTSTRPPAGPGTFQSISANVGGAASSSHVDPSKPLVRGSPLSSSQQLNAMIPNEFVSTRPSVASNASLLFTSANGSGATAVTSSNHFDQITLVRHSSRMFSNHQLNPMILTGSTLTLPVASNAFLSSAPITVASTSKSPMLSSSGQPVSVPISSSVSTLATASVIGGAATSNSSGGSINPSDLGSSLPKIYFSQLNEAILTGSTLTRPVASNAFLSSAPITIASTSKSPMLSSSGQPVSVPISSSVNTFATTPPQPFRPLFPYVHVKTEPVDDVDGMPKMSVSGGAPLQSHASQIEVQAGPSNVAVGSSVLASNNPTPIPTTERYRIFLSLQPNAHYYQLGFPPNSAPLFVFFRQQLAQILLNEKIIFRLGEIFTFGPENIVVKIFNDASVYMFDNQKKFHCELVQNGANTVDVYIRRHA